METMEFDILILGGGLAGASLACALRGSRYRVGLVERAIPRTAGGWDTRIYAISPANVVFLKQCGVWQHLDESRVAAVERMEVFGDAGGAMRFSAYECGFDALAWMAESGRVATELWETAKRQPNIQVFAPVVCEKLDVDDAAAHLSLADGRRLTASLVVGADGADSWVRSQAGIAADTEPYGEVGVVANFECERAHHGTAFQWFRADGVLAYLPLPGNKLSIVWSTPQDHAATLLALSETAFAAAVREAGQSRLGELTPLSPPAGFPLRLMRVAEPVAARLALIGDAAHSVHPLSGHGINLGFQDARVLAQELLALPAFKEGGELSVLRRYARARAEEVRLVQAVTHGLNRLFKPQFAPLSVARNFGLSLTGKMPVLRSTLARYAAGLL